MLATWHHDQLVSLVISCRLYMAAAVTNKTNWKDLFNVVFWHWMHDTMFQPPVEY